MGGDKGIDKTTAPNGVYILRINDKLYKREDWSNELNVKREGVGVAVITDNCRFVIEPALFDVMIWSASNLFIRDIVTTSNVDDAKKDFAGSYNTDIIVGYSGFDKNSAAGWCRNFSFSNGKKGYLGSLGEWVCAYENKEDVNSCLMGIGGSFITDYHWTSTQYAANAAWDFRWNDGLIHNIVKNSNKIKVRPFADL